MNTNKCCHDCGAKEGELHQLGCDMEKCALCGGQRISCMCDHRLQAAAQRIPWVEVPVMCAKCGRLWPTLFMEDDWHFYVPPQLQEKILCADCYEKMKRLFPDGWKAVGEVTT